MQTREEIIRHYTILAYFHYIPSRTYAIAALSVYVALAAITIIAALRYRSWSSLYMVLTAAFGSVGYALRLQMLEAPSLQYYVIMGLCLVVGPTLLAVTLYSTACKMLRNQGEDVGRFTIERICRFFHRSDFVIRCLLCAAGCLLGTGSPSTTQSAIRLMTAGLSLQVAFFACLGAVLLVLQRRSFAAGPRSNQWKVFVAMDMSLLLLILRTSYRLTQFTRGLKSYIAVHERFFYGLDSIPVALAIVLLTLFRTESLTEQVTEPKEDGLEMKPNGQKVLPLPSAPAGAGVA